MDFTVCLSDVQVCTGKMRSPALPSRRSQAQGSERLPASPPPSTQDLARRCPQTEKIYGQWNITHFFVRAERLAFLSLPCVLQRSPWHLLRDSSYILSCCFNLENRDEHAHLCQ